MKKFKIYIKKGTTNWKEKKLLKNLEPLIERKMATDPAFAANFRPITSFEDLQNMHSIYCSENATIISETKNDTIPQQNTTMETTNTSGQSTDPIDNKEPIQEKTSINNSKDYSDPLNESDPIIRDYVLSGDAYDQPSGPIQKPMEQQQAQVFNEPTNFAEAFTLPDLEDGGEKVSGGNEGNNNQNGQNNQNNGQQRPNNQNGNNNASKPKPEPLNPYSDDQSTKSKVKQTKRFAKYITAFVCMALEKGYVWWTTKDINEAKMIEYELKNEFDVNLMISIDERTRITAKEFFQQMCKDALINAKISQEDQDELSDALADVLMEKGITPTPMQTLLMVGGQIVGKQVLSAVMSTSVTSSILEGLRDRKKQDDEDEAALMEDAYERAEKRETPVPEQKETKTDDDVEYHDAVEV